MDLDLIISLRAGDTVVFTKVYQQFHQQIYSFIYYKTQSDFIASEVVQLTFIKLWQQRENLQLDTELNIQLFGMARQVMINELRKEATRNKYNSNLNQQPFTDSLMKAIESKDLLKHFETEIEHLPKMRKMVYNLSREQGFTHKEIAEMLSITPKTVENHIGKVLSRLKQLMYITFIL